MSKIALVTGGVRGLGAAISIALKEQGYFVVANYLNNHIAATNFEQKFDIPIMPWDVADPCASKEAVNKIVSMHGSIDILVNNAGIVKDNFIEKMNFDDWNKVVSNNLNSVFNLSKNVFPQMKNNRFGRIINISSVNASTGQLGQTNYSASKAGIFGFTKSLALEGAKFGITVNNIAPGYCDTEMMDSIPEVIMEKILEKIPVKRLANPSEIARAVTFLASKNASYITGSTLSINGGLNMA